MNKRSSGFTLVEILVVLAIIALLAALLFPAFSRAREGARRNNCQSNLSQIYFAVRQYYQDERRYPDSLVDLLGQGDKYSGAGNGGVLDTNAPGYLKGGASVLKCLDDDTDSTTARSSYGRLDVMSTALPSTITSSDDPANYVWNFYGYNDEGFAYQNLSDVTTGNPSVGGTYPYLTVTTAAFNAPPTASSNPAKPSNPVRYSLSNPFAPPSTIITHCVWHRVQSANNVTYPGELYHTTDATGSTNARDIILRLDGTAKSEDISTWKTDTLWQKQTQ